MINSLDNTPNQPSKFRTKDWVEIKDTAHGKYNTNNQTKFNTTMLNSCLCGLVVDVYLLKKLCQSQIWQAQVRPQITTIKNIYFFNI